MESYTVKAYVWKNGSKELVEWASEFTHRQADQYFKSLRDSEKFAKIEMSMAKLNEINY